MIEVVLSLSFLLFLNLLSLVLIVVFIVPIDSFSGIYVLPLLLIIPVFLYFIFFLKNRHQKIIAKINKSNIKAVKIKLITWLYLFISFSVFFGLLYIKMLMNEGRI